MKHLFNNSKGFSLTELMIATLITGFIGMQVSSLLKQQSDVKRDSQNVEAINETFKNLQSIIRYSGNESTANNCENVFPNAASLNNPSLSVQSNSSNLSAIQAGANITPTVTIQSLSSSRTGAISGKSRVQIDITFEVKQSNGQMKRVTKSFVRPVVINGATVKCENLDDVEVAEESLNTVCTNFLNGTVSGTNCNLNAGSINSDLQQHLRRSTCEVFGGTLDAADQCTLITVSGEVSGSNISNSQLCIGGGSDCRLDFDDTACGAGTYLTGMNIPGQSGSTYCSALSFP